MRVKNAQMNKLTRNVRWRRDWHFTTQLFRRYPLNLWTWVDDWLRTCSFAVLASLSFDRQLFNND